MSPRDPLKPLAKLHIHSYHIPKFRTIRPVVTENMSGQNVDGLRHAPKPGGPLSPPF